MVRPACSRRTSRAGWRATLSGRPSVSWLLAVFAAMKVRSSTWATFEGWLRNRWNWAQLSLAMAAPDATICSIRPSLLLGTVTPHDRSGLHVSSTGRFLVCHGHNDTPCLIPNQMGNKYIGITPKNLANHNECTMLSLAAEYLEKFHGKSTVSVFRYGFDTIPI